MVGLPDGEKNFEDLCIRLDKYRRVTDGRTDGRTSCHGIVRAMHTRRAVKTAKNADFLPINRYISTEDVRERLNSL